MLKIAGEASTKLVYEHIEKPSLKNPEGVHRIYTHTVTFANTQVAWHALTLFDDDPKSADLKERLHAATIDEDPFTPFDIPLTTDEKDWVMLGLARRFKYGQTHVDRACLRDCLNSRELGDDRPATYDEVCDRDYGIVVGGDVVGDVSMMPTRYVD